MRKCWLSKGEHPIKCPHAVVSGLDTWGVVVWVSPAIDLSNTHHMCRLHYTASRYACNYPSQTREEFHTPFALDKIA